MNVNEPLADARCTWWQREMRCRKGTLVCPSIDDRAHAVDVTLNKVSGIPPKPQCTTRGSSRGLYNCLTMPSKSRDEVGEGRGRDDKDGVRPRIRWQIRSRRLRHQGANTASTDDHDECHWGGRKSPGRGPAGTSPRVQVAVTATVVRWRPADISLRARRLGDIIDDADGVEDRVHFGRRGRQRQRRPGRETRLSLVPVTKIGYFGTYIRYLPNSPMSLQLWLTTDIFRYLFRISTSSSTVELVYFVRILFDDTSQKL